MDKALCTRRGMNRFTILAAFLFITLNLTAGMMENRVEARMQDITPLIGGLQLTEQSGSGGNFISNALNSIVGGVITLAGYPLDTFKLMIKWAFWDYDYLNGSYIYFKWVVLYPISFGLVFGLIFPLVARII